jgi:propanol-preferring alcohol dehydrogenase
MIGYRSLLKAGDGRRLGIYGFGAAAHIVTQIARYEGREVFAFTRPRDSVAQQFARESGANWAGGSDEQPPELLDAAILFAPVGDLIPQALRVLTKGGVVVCGGIHMSDIPRFPYELLWHERTICSVANLTRHDGHAFLEKASVVPVHVQARTFPLKEANEALAFLRQGELLGAAVLTI